MRKTTILAVITILFSHCILTQAQPTGRTSFNKGWSVVHNVDKDYMLFKYQMGLQAVELAPTVDLPHDWGVEGPFRQELPGSTGKLEWWGYARYWKDFILLKPQLEGKQFFLEIDGAMARPKVYCNDQYVGEWAYGYASFRLDITPYLREGGNCIMIDIDNQNGSSRWYPGGGIYRNVWLTISDPVGIGHHGTYVTTQLNGNEATVNLEVTLRNNSNITPSGTVTSIIYKELADGRKEKVGEAASTQLEKIVDGEKISQQFKITNPELWSVNNPELYSIETSVDAQEYHDSYNTRFGIRTIEFNKDGFFLNGEKTKLNGVCLHHDSGALGAVWNTSAWVRRLNMLKQMGCNAIRTSHNPPAPELLDLCDEMGFLVIDELADNWTVPKTRNGYTTMFEEWGEKDLVALIHRDRNHPSVILWSTGNEVGEQGNPDKWHISQRLTDICHREDPSRLSTVGCDNLGASETDWRHTMDVYGFNYKPRAYGQFREANPDKPYYGSETASTISSRSVYVFPVSDNKDDGKQDFQMSSYDLYAPRWANDPDTEFAAQDKYPWVAGEFVWTGFDYIGEPTPYNSDITVLTNFHNEEQKAKAAKELEELGRIRVPSRSSYFGIIDLAGFPKDRYWIYQARWRPDIPMAHILPHWNWEGREGEITPVMVYTSGDSAELFINGKSQGMKTKGEYEYRLRWDDVVYESGVVKVVAYKDGKVWAKDEVRTTGKAAKVMVAAELGMGPGKDFGGDKLVKNSRKRMTIKASDYTSDINPEYMFIDVKIADKRGRIVPTANNELTFKISGPAELVATDAGDASSHIPFSSNVIPAFNGLCSAIIRPTGEPGTIVITVESNGLKCGKLKIKCKA